MAGVEKHFMKTILNILIKRKKAPKINKVLKSKSESSKTIVTPENRNSPRLLIDSIPQRFRELLWRPCSTWHLLRNNGPVKGLRLSLVFPSVNPHL